MAVVAADKYPSVEIDTGDHTPIGDDEVVFVLRANDETALPTLRDYRVNALALGCHPEHVAAIDRSIEQFKEYQRTHTESVKTPD